MFCVLVMFCAEGRETEHRLKMVDTRRGRLVSWGMGTAANGGECAFALPSLHYSSTISSPASSNLSAIQLAGWQVMAPTMPALTPFNHPALEFRLSTNNKEPCAVTWCGVLCKAQN